MFVSINSYASDYMSFVEHHLNSFMNNDWDSYKQGGSEKFQNAIKKESFNKIQEAIASRLKSGYKVELLGTLKFKDPEICYQVWKVSFNNGEPDILLRTFIRISDSKFDGFWIHW
jgi:hypothetical protein